MPLVTDVSAPMATTRSAHQLVGPVAQALWIWDTLRLDIGEVALVTGDTADSALVALAATWYGALPVRLVTNGPVSTLPRVSAQPPIAGGEETKELAKFLSGRPGTAAVDLTGRSDTIDVLFEAMPRFSRLMLAGTAREPLTIDYYVNVHRKGVRVVSAALDHPSASLSAEIALRSERATRLLARPDRFRSCVDALNGLGGRTVGD